MKAVKFFSQVSNPDNVPGDWPAIVESGPVDMVIPEGYTGMTDAEYAAYVAAHQAEFDAWQDDNSPNKIALKQKRRDQIDAKTDELLATGFIYDGKQFKMDLEHQNSYTFDFMLDQTTYPRTVKGVGNDYLEIADRNEHTNFIGTGFITAKTIIETGWALKDALDSMTYQQLTDWVDPRS